MWPRLLIRLFLKLSRHPRKEDVVAVYRKHYLFDHKIKIDALTVSNVLVHLRRCPECAYHTLNA